LINLQKEEVEKRKLKVSKSMADSLKRNLSKGSKDTSRENTPTKESLLKNKKNIDIPSHKNTNSPGNLTPRNLEKHINKPTLQNPREDTISKDE